MKYLLSFASALLCLSASAQTTQPIRNQFTTNNAMNNPSDGWIAVWNNTAKKWSNAVNTASSTNLPAYLQTATLTNLAGTGLSAGATNAGAYVGSAGGLGTNLAVRGITNTGAFSNSSRVDIGGPVNIVGNTTNRGSGSVISSVEATGAGTAASVVMDASALLYMSSALQGFGSSNAAYGMIHFYGGLDGSIQTASISPTGNVFYGHFDIRSNLIARTAELTVDDAYAAGWNASLGIPTKNAIYDKIESIVAGTTAWNNIGDATGIGTIDFANNAQDITTAQDSGTSYVLTLVNTDTDIANNTDLLRLVHYDTADANAYYMRFQSDGGGAPVDDYIFGQTLFQLDPAIPFAPLGGITEGSTNFIAGLTEDQTPATNDTIMVQDKSAGRLREVALGNMPISGPVQAAIDGISGGSGGTNFPAILSLTSSNVTIQSGKRTAFYLVTNGVHGYDIDLAAPESGNTVRLYETNSSGSGYTVTFFTNGVASQFFDIAEKTNNSTWYVPEGSLVVVDLTWTGNQWVMERKAPSLVVDFAGQISGHTNGLRLTISNNIPILAIGGSSADIQFNETGVFAGTNRLRFDRTNHVLTISSGQTDIPSTNANRARLIITNDSTFYAEYNVNGVHSFGQWGIYGGPALSSYGTNAFMFDMALGFYSPTDFGMDLGAINYRWRTNYIGRVQAAQGVTTPQVLYDLSSITVVGANSNQTVRLGMTNYVDMLVSTNMTLTNFTGFASGVAGTWTAFIKVTNSASNLGINYGNLGLSNPGYGVALLTNANAPMWTTLTNTKTYALTYVVRGTNIHPSISLWE